MRPSDPLIVRLRGKPLAYLTPAELFILTAWNFAQYGTSHPSAEEIEAREGYHPKHLYYQQRDTTDDQHK